MSNETKPDSKFNRFVKDFRHAFGIEREIDVQTQQHKDLPEHVRIDALVVFPFEFDFTKLRKRLFPFLCRYNIFEYKSQGDRLMVAHFYQYSLVELGLIITRLLTYRRKDRGEWKSLSQKAAIAQWEDLSGRGAKHSSCVVILSTTDPRELRKTVGFQPVADYPHLEGALYRKVILEDNYIGSIATYLVVLNELPLCALNAPLLLLTTKKKKTEFCKWLQSDIPGITLEEKRSYLLYLLEKNLIKDQEVEKEIMYNLFGEPDHGWLFDHFDERSEEERTQFLQQVHKRILHASSRQEAAQKLLDAKSPEEMAQKALGANTPLEAAQKALGADTPFEAALKFLQTEEQRREFMARLQQMNPMAGK